MRIKYGKESRFSTNITNNRDLPYRCHDCGAKIGEKHKPNCDMEQCAICGKQLVTCEHGRK